MNGLFVCYDVIMEEVINTGFKDKAGRTVHVNDVLQHRLGFSKSGGPKNFKIIKYGKKYHLVNEYSADDKYGGIPLTNTICENSVVLRCDHIRR